MSNFLKIVNIFDIIIEYRNGTESWLMLPLRHGDGRAMPSRMPAAGVLRKRHFHNGTESRLLLPLRHGNRRAMPSKRPTAGVLRKRHFHNGTDSRDLLPLRHGNGWAMPSRRPTAGQCRPEGLQQGSAKKLLPQRHRITAFAAVAARRRKGNSDKVGRKCLWSKPVYNEIKKVGVKQRFDRHLPAE